MSIQSQIHADGIAALKAKDIKKRSALSYLSSELKKLCIDKRVEALSDAESISVLQKQLKLRKEVVETSLKANRQDLADEASYELDVIQAYLPKTLGAEETHELAFAAIAATEAKVMKDMSKAMNWAIQREPGVDKSLLSSIVKKHLSPK